MSTTTTPNTKPPKSAQSEATTYFLILYNSVNAILWSAVLGRVIIICLLFSYSRVNFGVGEFVKWTQTLAIMEIVFSLTGLVRAPFLTTAMQVASRLLLVWGIVNNFPLHTTRTPFYSTMLVAWSVTEVIRYSFFALNLWFHGRVPPVLQWLRYNTFFILYPLGITSECALVFKSIYPASAMYPGSEILLFAILAIYVPGSYVLFTHMMAQRRKVMKSRKAE